MGDSDPDAAVATVGGGVVGRMVGQDFGLSAAGAAEEAEWPFPFPAKMCSILWGVVIDLEEWLLLLDIWQWNW